MTLADVIGRHPAVSRWGAHAAVLGVPILTGALSLALVGPADSAGNLITPDGRTNTTLSTSGSVTNVTTSTIQGANAYNSFNQFQIGSGNSVNLQVPDQAKNLLNVVHGGPVSIDGTLNAYKNGKIGGNVFFADPYGMVVGPTGAVNVGALTVSTPRADALDRVIDPTGHIDSAATADLMAGTMPVSPDGVVLIKGRVNAPNGVNIAGQSVTVAAPDSAQTFDASVNAKGLSRGGAIKVVNGNIVIVVAGDATVGGTMTADGAPGRAGGTVSVTAGNDVALQGSARISAKGHGAQSDGGQVSVLAAQDLSVGKGAKVDVSGGDSGDGGGIELSAKGTADIAGATLNAGAAAGKTGSVVIDPTDLVIDSGASVDSNGADISLSADNSITVSADAYINTRMTAASGGTPTPNDLLTASIGNSGNVSLTAPHIAVDGAIIASVINSGGTTYTPGDINLMASDSQSALQGIVTSGSSIDISGALAGGNITAIASAQSTSSYGDFSAAFSTLSSLFGADVGLVDAQASAAINIANGANIKGTGDVTFNAWTNTQANDNAYNLDFATVLNAIGLGLVPTVIVGNVTNNAMAEIASGATVSAGGALTVRAANAATIDVSTITVTSNNPVDVSLTYTTANITANALVDPGANVSAGSARINAYNDDSFSNTNTVYNLGTGSAGLAVSLADGYNSAANANLGTSLALNGPTPAGDAQLVVQADTHTDKDVLKASTQVGNGVVENVLSWVGGKTGASDFLVSKLPTSLVSLMLGQGGDSPPVPKPKVGSAMALDLDEKLSATATIAGDPASPPVISASGPVAVLADVTNNGIGTAATSAVNSPAVADATPANPAATVGISAGVNYSQRTLNADAEIGTGTQITASQIGVLANATTPLTTFTFDDLYSASAIEQYLAGTYSSVLTTYADATASAPKGGFSGAVNYYSAEANSTAFVGDGAQITSTAPATASQDWTALYDTGNNSLAGRGASPKQANFDSAIDIEAERSLLSINLTGSVFPNTTTYGGGVQLFYYSGEADAGVGQQAVVTDNDDLSVAATSYDQSFILTPSATVDATSPEIGVSGMASVFNSNTTTHASISSSAEVDANAVAVNAEQHFKIAALAGGIGVTTTEAAGAMLAVNTITSDTNAYVGDNSADDPSASLAAGFSPLVNPASTVAGSYSVSATDSGDIQSAAFTLQIATDGSGAGAAAAVDNIDTAPTASISGAVISATDLLVQSNAQNTIQTLAMGFAGGNDGAIAGSAASGTISDSPRALIEGGATIDAANNAGVIAGNSDVIETIAGAAAIGAKAGGIGASVVVNQISGDTLAAITGSDTTVNARGLDPTDTMAVNSGNLANPIDIAAITAPSLSAPGLSETQQQVSGLAVSATSSQSVVTNAVTLGISGGGALSGNTVNNILSGSTTAEIEDARIDTLLADPTDAEGTLPPVVFPDTVVRASSHTYAENFAVGIALSNDFSGAAVSGVDEFKRKTDAHVSGATLGTLDDGGVALNGALDVGAFSTQDAPQIVLGGAASASASLAGSLAVALFDADTRAYVDDGNFIATSLGISAQSDNGANALIGAAAYGEGGGFAASFGIAQVNNTTLAYTGDSTGSAATNLTVSGTSNIAATSDSDLTSLAVSGTLVANVYAPGIAAMANVAMLSSTTKANIYNATLNAGPAATGDVAVTANENDKLNSNAGSLAGGGVGVGVGANFIGLNSTVAATVIDSDITSSGAVDVAANSDHDLDMVTATGAVGYYAGISAAIGVIEAGTALDSDVSGQINSGGSGTLANAQSLQQSSCSDGDTTCSGTNILASLTSPDSVQAGISGGSVTADSVGISALGTISASNIAIGGAIAVGVGVGGAAAVTTVGDEVVASLGGTSVNAANVSIAADVADGGSGKAAEAQSYAAGGGVVGIGAGVSRATIANTVAAGFAGTANGDGTGTFSITANDHSSMHSEADGGAAGAVAIGVMVAQSTKNSSVSASTANSASLLGYQNVALSAASGGGVSASATGVAGGLVDAGVGAGATATDSATVVATLGDSTNISGASGLVSVLASDAPGAEADAYGVAVSEGDALGVSTALADVNSTVRARAGDNVSIADSGGLTIAASAAPDGGGDGANAQAFAGTGGEYLAINGAIAISKNRGVIEATTGDSAILPGGDVSITATNNSSQRAYGSGVSVGGGAGGASYAQALSSAKVDATLGTNTTNVPSLSLTVQATGTDANDARALAGTYGVVAGNAAVAETDNTSTISTVVGEGTALMAGIVSIGAVHNDNYTNFTDSTEVSAVGASGAYSNHVANVTVSTTIGDNVTVLAGGALDITAQSNFDRIGSGDSVDAGGGGVINGAAAFSNTGIDSSAQVLTGDDDTLTSGFDAITNPGGISILASSQISGKDVVNLETGGALEGSGTSNKFNANLDNAVTLGSDNLLLSFGNINVGTFTSGQVTIESLGSTWGVLAGTADAETKLAITTNQNVTLGADSQALAYGNINFNAGQDPDSAQTTAIYANAISESYARGLIGIPTATADATVKNYTSVAIDSQGLIEAGGNASIGAYTGTLKPVATAEGHGYVLWGIPFTDGSAHKDTDSSADVAINADVTAGAFNNVTIDIPDCADDGIFCKTFTMTGNFAQAALIEPVAAYMSAFNPDSYIEAHASPADAAFLETSVSAGTVGALEFGAMLASGGNITVNGSALTGSGTLTANGGANITITNASPDYLIVDGAKIPDVPGGNVYFTGALTAAPASFSVAQNMTGGDNAVSIIDTYEDALPGSSYGAAIFLAGDIEDLGGIVHVAVPLGSLGQFATIEAQNVILDVPQGIVLVSLPSPDLYTTGVSVYADYDSEMLWPGGPGFPTSTKSVNEAVMYAVSAAVPYPGGTPSNDTYTKFLLDETSQGNGYNEKLVPLGACTQSESTGNGANCSKSVAKDQSIVGAAFGVDGRNHTYYFPELTAETLSHTVTTAPPLIGSGRPSLTANKVQVTADYIDIDSAVSIGPANNWLVDLPSTLNSETALLDSTTAAGTKTLLSDAVVKKGGVVASPDDADKVNVYYQTGDAPGTGQIIVDDVLASAQSSSSISLNGKIIGTNTFGNIHVNAGLGDVTINNESSSALVVNNISAGNADRAGGITGTIEIADTLTDTHQEWVFTPGVGTDYYMAAGAQTALPSTPTTFYTAAQSANLVDQPLVGSRWQWTEDAFLSRVVTPSNGTSTPWQWTDSSGNPLANASGIPLSSTTTSPWFYVDPATGLPTQDSSAAGRIVTVDLSNDAGDTGNANYLKETITGTIGDILSFHDQSVNWYYPQSASLTIVASVKADNPIGINFSGNSVGSVVINSNTAVTINGQINNPSGATSITADDGGIFTTANGAVKSKELTLDTAGAIGTESNLLAITQTGGALNASGDQGVYIAASSNLSLGTVGSLNGDVFLTANNGIANAGATPQAITGANVTLTAGNGSIGTTASPITMAATGTLNASAPDDISINQTTGDLLVGQVQSTAGTGGNISLVAENGKVLDVNNTTATQTLNDAQVQDIWSRLKLTVANGAGSNGSPTSATVTSIESTVTNDYQQYWTLLGNGTASSGTFTLDPAKAALYDAVAAASNMTPDQYAAQLYTRVTGDFVQYIGTNWQSDAAFQSQVANYGFVPSSDQIGMLTDNSAWTEGELLSALSLTAIQPSTDTSIGGGTPNVAGGNLSLAASSGIGQLADPVSISIADLISGNLSTQQKAAIALAKNPGDLTFYTDSGEAVATTDLLISNGDGINHVDIEQAAPLFVLATGTLDAVSTQGGIYVQATDGDLNVHLAQTGSGEVSLAAPGSILGSQDGGAYVIKGDSVSLLAGAGDLGSAANPLIYSADVVSSASAGDSLYLESFGGDLAVGRVFAGATASLYAPSASIVPTLSGVAIDATDLILRTGAGGSVGSAAAALQFELSGNLSGNAGQAYLYDPSGNLHITNFVTAGTLMATAANGLYADNLQSSAGSVMVASGADAAFGDISAYGAATLAAAGNLTLAMLTTGSDGTVAAGGAAAITNASIGGNANVTSGGTLTIDQLSGSNKVTASGANAVLGAIDAKGAASLSATSDLTLAMLTTGGDGTVAAGGDASITNASIGGNANVTSGGTLTIDQLSGSNYVTISGADAFLGTLDAKGAASLSATNDLTLAMLTTGGDGTVAAGGDAAITNASIGGNTNVTSGGTLTIDQLSGSNYVTISGADAFLGTLDAKGAASLSAASDLTLAMLTTGGDGTVAAGGDAAITNASIGGNANVTSGGTLTINQLSGSNKVTASSANAVLGAIDAKEAASLSAINDLTLAMLTTGSDGTVAAGGDAALTKASIGGNANVTSGGTLTIDQLSSAGTTTIKAGGAMIVSQNGALKSNGVLSAQAASLTMGSGSSITSAGALNAAVTGSAVLGRLASTLNAAGAVTVKAGSIMGNGDGQTNVVALGANASSLLSAQSGIGASALYLTVNTPSLMPTTVAGGVYIHALSDIALPNLSEPGDVAIQGDGDVTLAGMTAGGAASLNAAGNLSAGDINAGSSFTATAGDKLSLGTANSMDNQMLQAGGDIVFTLLHTLGIASDIEITSTGADIVGGTIDPHDVDIFAAANASFADIDAANVTSQTGGVLSANRISAKESATLSATGGFSIVHLLADSLSLGSPVNIALGDVEVGNHLAVATPSSTLVVRQTGTTGPLHVDIGGFAPGSSAESASLDIDSPNGLDFANFAASKGNIVTTANVVNIAKGHVTNDLTLATPDVLLYLNDQKPTPVADVGVQLYAPSTNFQLSQDHLSTITDAFIVNYGSDYIVSTLNLDGSVSTGFSLTREPALALSAGTWQRVLAQNGYGSAERLYILNSLAAGDAPPDALDPWLRSVTTAGAVNAGP